MAGQRTMKHSESLQTLVNEPVRPFDAEAFFAAQTANASVRNEDDVEWVHHDHGNAPEVDTSTSISSTPPLPSTGSVTVYPTNPFLTPLPSVPEPRGVGSHAQEQKAVLFDHGMLDTSVRAHHNTSQHPECPSGYSRVDTERMHVWDTPSAFQHKVPMRRRRSASRSTLGPDPFACASACRALPNPWPAQKQSRDLSTDRLDAQASCPGMLREVAWGPQSRPGADPCPSLDLISFIEIMEPAAFAFAKQDLPCSGTFLATCDANKSACFVPTHEALSASTGGLGVAGCGPPSPPSQGPLPPSARATMAPPFLPATGTREKTAWAPSTRVPLHFWNPAVHPTAHPSSASPHVFPPTAISNAARYPSHPFFSCAGSNLHVSLSPHLPAHAEALAASSQADTPGLSIFNGPSIASAGTRPSTWTRHSALDSTATPTTPCPQPPDPFYFGPLSTLAHLFKQHTTATSKPPCTREPWVTPGPGTCNQILTSTTASPLRSGTLPSSALSSSLPTQHASPLSGLSKTSVHRQLSPRETPIETGAGTRPPSANPRSYTPPPPAEIHGAFIGTGFHRERIACQEWGILPSSRTCSSNAIECAARQLSQGDHLSGQACFPAPRQSATPLHSSASRVGALAGLNMPQSSLGSDDTMAYIPSRHEVPPIPPFGSKPPVFSVPSSASEEPSTTGSMRSGMAAESDAPGARTASFLTNFKARSFFRRSAPAQSVMLDPAHCGQPPVTPSQNKPPSVRVPQRVVTFFQKIKSTFRK